MKSFDSGLNKAIDFLKVGRLIEAAEICNKLLHDSPNNSHVLYISGIVSYQNGNASEAIDFLYRSLETNKENIDARQTLIRMLCAHERYEEAIPLLQMVLDVRPDSEEAHYNLGNIFYILGRDDPAIEQFTEAIRSKNDFEEAHLNLGNALYRKGDFATSIEQFRKVVSLNPSSTEGWYCLGRSLFSQGNLSEAVSPLEKAISLNPAFHDAHKVLGIIHHEKGRLNDAVTSFIHALDIDPENDNTLYMIGVTFLALKQYAVAQKYFEKATKINPENVSAFCNLGFSLKDQLRQKMATKAFVRALEIDPNCSEAYSGLSDIYIEQGHPDEAIPLLKKAIRLKPDNVEAHQTLLLALHYSMRHSPKEIFREHLDFASTFEIPLGQHRPLGTYTRGRKLRIGYVSPDFRQHSVSYFIEPVLLNHEREKFEIFLYYNTRNEDDVSLRFKKLSDHWHNISNLSDDKVEDLIRNDRIDILVDLAGHTRDNRLPVFARKPAPVQVTWIGYPNTTGLSTIDYRITDSYLDPAGSADELYSEKLIRLPGSFSAYLPPKDAPKVRDSPPAIQNGFVTFGSFNNIAKMNPEVVNCWSTILNALPNAKLVLKSYNMGDYDIAKSVQKSFLNHGIDSDRLTLLVKDELIRQHLEHYNNIDLALDTFPYNGTTTTCEALWMGVPVVVLEGNSHVSRVGYSIMRNLDYRQLISSNLKEYVDIAVRLASDCEGLRIFRSELRSRFNSSPVMDAKQLTQNIEKVFLEIWGKWYSNQ